MTEYFISRSLPNNSAVLHAHFLWMMKSAQEIKERTGLPVCVTAYGEDELFLARKNNEIPKDLEIAANSADVILTTSNYLLRILKDLLGNQKRIELWHIGVDTQSYTRVEHQEKKCYRVLSVGRLIQRKGFRYLVEAIPLVVKQIPNVKFKIIGEGDQRKELDALIEKLGIQDSIEIVGVQNSLQNYYSSSDLFVLPSLMLEDGITEGLGVPIIEAQASGLPVIASDVGGIPDIVVNGRSGLLVKPADPEQLARCIIRLISDSKLRNDFGQVGRIHAHEEFELHKQAASLAETYSALMK